ncbi:hypothetical protein DFH07DRAFT_778559 [Mycena maculata]|uniref:Uncharacterized protein n=1 Tax=Mycena maculata TaxID=230809 RepID=A0AAD7IDR1_9AGAR|nr:hypothetical protein DFH07DRAFT_778559 [Mycena maculata]
MVKHTNFRGGVVRTSAAVLSRRRLAAAEAVQTWADNQTPRDELGNYDVFLTPEWVTIASGLFQGGLFPRQDWDRHASGKYSDQTNRCPSRQNSIFIPADPSTLSDWITPWSSAEPPVSVNAEPPEARITRHRCQQPTKAIVDDSPEVIRMNAQGGQLGQELSPEERRKYNIGCVVTGLEVDYYEGDEVGHVGGHDGHLENFECQYCEAVEVEPVEFAMKES